MSLKRKVEFQEDTDNIDLDLGDGDGKKKKHTLDSDEDDDEETDDKYNVMTEDDIEGQEEATVDFDEGIKITPFNMQEELEEGHFDAQGTYIFDKQEEIRDNWMDDIDWVKVKHQAKSEEEDGDDSDDGQPEKVNEDVIYQQIVTILKPGETITKALRRLGSGTKDFKSMSASERLKAKKLAAKGSKSESNEESTKNKIDIEKLTELADRLLQQGNFEIYQETFESITFKIKTAEEANMKKKTSIPEGIDEDDALDMFADDFDTTKETVDSRVMIENGNNTDVPDVKNPSDKSSVDPVLDEVMWLYKWKTEDEKEHGPYTSTEMLQWTEENFFPDGVFCKKVGQKEFYSSKRIDFDLYT